MANPVWFNVYVTVKDGRLDEFKSMAKEMIAAHRDHAEILGYEWFFTSEDETKCQIMELYESSEAVLADF